jgi:hypothetical protein
MPQEPRRSNTTYSGTTGSDRSAPQLRDIGQEDDLDQSA